MSAKIKVQVAVRVRPFNKRGKCDSTIYYILLGRYYVDYRN